MKKYYAIVETENGEVLLTIRGKDEESAKTKLFKSYRFKRLVEFKDKPIRLKPSSSTINSSLNTIGSIQYLTNIKL